MRIKVPIVPIEKCQLLRSGKRYEMYLATDHLYYIYSLSLKKVVNRVHTEAECLGLFEEYERES